MNENKERKERRWSKWSGEKKFYLFTAIGCAAVLIAIVVIAIAVTSSSSVKEPIVQDPPTSDAPVVEQPTPDEDQPVVEQPEPDEDTPVVVVPEGMTMPIDAVSVSNDYGFFHNQTLNTYYEHEGLDFTAAAGTEVKAVHKGVVERITTGDILTGTEIVIDHGEGLKTVYRFVTHREDLAVGDTVERGEVIATVAEATGNEYKDGPHLHFEIYENGKRVDPTSHLTLEEK